MSRRGLQRIVSAAISCTPAKTAAVFLAVLFGSLSLLPVAARANYVDITQTGLVVSGTDTSGIFGAPGADLTGDSYTLVTTYDDTAGVQTTTTCTAPCGSSIAWSASTSDPVVSSVLTIGSGSFSFASFPNTTSQNGTYRTIPPDGSEIEQQLVWAYGVEGIPPNEAFSGNGSAQTQAEPSTGGSWTTDYRWEDSYSNASLGVNNGEFNIQRTVYSNPANVQQANGVLAAGTITVSGPYTPGTGKPPAAATNPAKNNGCPACNGGTTAVQTEQPAMDAPAQMPNVDTANGGGSLFPNAVSAVGVRTVASVKKNVIASSGSTNTGTGTTTKLRQIT